MPFEINHAALKKMPEAVVLFGMIAAMANAVIGLFAGLHTSIPTHDVSFDSGGLRTELSFAEQASAFIPLAIVLTLAFAALCLRLVFKRRFSAAVIASFQFLPWLALLAYMPFAKPAA